MKLPKWRQIKVAKKPIEVSEKEVEEALESLRKMKRQEKVIAKPATTEDKVVVDFDLFVGKVPLEGGQARKHGIYLNEKYYIPGLNDQLVGLKAGEAKEFNLKFPDNHYQAHLKGKNVDCKVKV